MGKQYGCIGRNLTHSYSVAVHNALADYDYKLLPMEPADLEKFFAEKAFGGVNVTIPYKEAVLPFLDEADAIAHTIGAVNTVVNRGGKLYGYNTDFFGLSALLQKNKIELQSKKVLILGTGGTSKTAYAVALAQGARQIVKVSRTPGEGAVTYEQAVALHRDAEVIINTTPVGMFPHKIGHTPVDITLFSNLCGVADAVYNPLRSALVLSAQERGLPACGGLYMLVMQGVKAVELFTGKAVPSEKGEEAYRRILLQKQNLVLTGMPACGKSTVGKILAEKLHRKFVDTDTLIAEKEGMEIPAIFAEYGESYFRQREREVISSLTCQTGLVIATGGGSVLFDENVKNLKANGKLCFLDMPPDRLVPTADRPLSKTREAVARRYEERYSVYKKTADCILVPPLGAEQTAQRIAEEWL